MHLFSTCMVALGTLFSAIWIPVANSWMQTPGGYHSSGGPFLQLFIFRRHGNRQRR